MGNQVLRSGTSVRAVTWNVFPRVFPSEHLLILCRCTWSNTQPNFLCWRTSLAERIVSARCHVKCVPPCFSGEHRAARRGRNERDAWAGQRTRAASLWAQLARRLSHVVSPSAHNINGILRHFTAFYDILRHFTSFYDIWLHFTAFYDILRHFTRSYQFSIILRNSTLFRMWLYKIRPLYFARVVSAGLLRPSATCGRCRCGMTTPVRVRAGSSVESPSQTWWQVGGGGWRAAGDLHGFLRNYFKIVLHYFTRFKEFNTHKKLECGLATFNTILRNLNQFYRM